MALIKCKECGKDVSKKAKVCPYCGVKNPGLTLSSWLSTFFKTILYSLAGLVLVMVAIGFLTDKTSTASTTHKEQSKSETSQGEQGDRIPPPKHVTQSRSDKPIQHTILGQYHSGSGDWVNVFIPQKSASKKNLIELAKQLHKSYPGKKIHFFDDTQKVDDYTRWDQHYPSKEYPYPEKWVEKHLIADLQFTGSNWRLVDRDLVKIADLISSPANSGEANDNAISELKKETWVKDVYVSPGHMNIGVIHGEKDWSSPMISRWACAILVKYDTNLPWVRFVDIEKIAAGKSIRQAEIYEARCQ